MSELFHFGIKRRSGRYPYGSGERPYQGDKQINLSDPDIKKKVLKKADATFIEKKYKGDLSNQELREVVERLRLEDQLSNYSEKETKTLFKTVDQLMKKVKRITEWTVIALAAYNQIENILSKEEEE